MGVHGYWRPEVYTICLLQSLPYVLRKDFLVNLEFTDLARPAGQDTPVTLLSLPHYSWAPLQSLLRPREAVCQLSHPSSSRHLSYFGWLFSLGTVLVLGKVGFLISTMGHYQG